MRSNLWSRVLACSRIWLHTFLFRYEFNHTDIIVYICFVLTNRFVRVFGCNFIYCNIILYSYLCHHICVYDLAGIHIKQSRKVSMYINVYMIQYIFVCANGYVFICLYACDVVHQLYIDVLGSDFYRITKEMV